MTVRMEVDCKQIDNSEGLPLSIFLKIIWKSDK